MKRLYIYNILKQKNGKLIHNISYDEDKYNIYSQYKIIIYKDFKIYKTMHIYVLLLENNKFYVGHSTEIIRRINEHVDIDNKKRGALWT